MGPPTRPGLWLYPATDKNGKVSVAGAPVGADGLRGENTTGTSADWNGATVSPGDFDADNAQDILVRLPDATTEGNVMYAPGGADGSTFDRTLTQAIKLSRVDPEADGKQTVDQITAIPATAGRSPDIYAIVGDDLYWYRASLPPAAFASPKLISGGWSNHTITGTRQGGKPVLYSRHNTTGKLTLWTIATSPDSSNAPTATPITLANSGFDAASTPVISGTDMDADGRADLWALAPNGDLRAYHTAERDPLPSPTITNTGPGDRLAAGQSLYRGGFDLRSPSGRYRLALQGSDGNLVLRDVEAATWAVGALADAAFFDNQTDGNLVIYNAVGTPLKSSATMGQGPTTLFLQDDGNLVLRRNSDHKALWDSKDFTRTSCPRLCG